MIDIEKFLAELEQVPEARNLYGVRDVIEQLQAELDRIKSRVKSEEEVRNELTPDIFVDSDIDYLCMLASYGKQVVRVGWLKTFARKIKTTLAELDKLREEVK